MDADQDMNWKIEWDTSLNVDQQDTGLDIDFGIGLGVGQNTTIDWDFGLRMVSLRETKGEECPFLLQVMRMRCGCNMDDTTFKDNYLI